MSNVSRLASLLLGITVTGSLACGGESKSGGGGGQTGPLPCQAESCGMESYRRAIPGRGTVRINFQRTAARIAPGAAEPGRGGLFAIRPPGRGTALEAVAPAYLELADHVDEINGFIDVVFGELEELSGEAPELEEETAHQWRTTDDTDPGVEYVLRLESSDEASFALAYAVGPAGFEPAAEDVFMVGTIAVADGEQAAFDLVIDFDIASAAFPAEEPVTGTLGIRSEIDGEGDREIWYDFTDFGLAGGELETSLTTYWVRGDGGGALEYLDALYGSNATIFARWDDGAGRLDYDVQWADGEEISTTCWAEAGAETFFAIADGDASVGYHVEIDGDEASCAFGPLDGHPDPGEEFANLPVEGEWDDLLDASVPYCEDEPDAFDCVSYCELFPDAC